MWKKKTMLAALDALILGHFQLNDVSAGTHIFCTSATWKSVPIVLVTIFCIRLVLINIFFTFLFFFLSYPHEEKFPASGEWLPWPTVFIVIESKFCTFCSFPRNANYKINTMCKTTDKSKDQMGGETKAKLLFTLALSVTPQRTILAIPQTKFYLRTN